jgi:MbtH protein
MDEQFKVLMNDEEQYSLWQADLDIPLGWYEKFHGTREDCLNYIKEVWTDMRPKSLRDFEEKNRQ